METKYRLMLKNGYIEFQTLPDAIDYQNKNKIQNPEIQEIFYEKEISDSET